VVDAILVAVWLVACLPRSPQPVTPLSTSNSTPGLPHLHSQTPSSWPAVLPASTSTPPPPTSHLSSSITRLLFTGDINPGRCPAQIALAHDDFTLPYQFVADQLRAADLTIGSLDGSLSDLGPPMACPHSMNLIGPARTVEGLTFAGFDVITVAANHAKDCGRLGWGCDDHSFLDTLHNLSQAGIVPVGGGLTLPEARAPVIVERHGVRFAFLGVTEVGSETWATEHSPGTAPLSGETLDAVLADIAAARAVADVVVVLPQWGIEYEEAPSPQQRAWAGQMVAAGATLVVGNHPHLIQPVEVFPHASGVTAYALGNFVFDQGPWRTRQGAVLEAVFRGNTLESWRLLPVHIYSLYQVRWAEPDEARAILARVAQNSASLPTR
jgi:poly-gamma-glutamate synthesis protein (capsule biosynthesis protein)